MNATTRLEDTLEIAALPVRYSLAIDSGNWDLMLSCMAPSAVFVTGDARFEGAEAVKEMTKAALDGLDHSQHYISNVVVELAGDTASLTSYLQAQHMRAEAEGDGITFLVGGIFRDRAERSEGGWRFVERNLSVLWSEGNPAVHPSAR